VIDDAFENDYPRALDSFACAIQQLSHPGQHRSLHCRQRAAVHVESRNALQDPSIPDEDRCSLLLDHGQRVSHAFQPPILHEN